MLNGVTGLIMMKIDVLDQFEMLKVCVGYEINGEVVETFPFEIDDRVKPIYVELPGWKTDLTGIKNQEEFPDALRNYIRFIEEETGIPVTIASVGPNREQTIMIKK